MTDDHDAPEDERAVELSSIAAIFPELVIDPSDPFCATIDLPVTPKNPLAVLFPPLADGAPPAELPTPPTSDEASDVALGRHEPVRNASATDNVVPDVYYLSHLPPLTLQIRLPQGYPTEKPPVFHLRTRPSWLPGSTLQMLREAGSTLWEEMGRDQVVYSYIDHLQQAAEGGFDLIENEEITLKIPHDMKIALLAFDINAKRARFEQETFECGVCLEPKKGSVCHRLLVCGHVFCVACLQDFYNNCITEGDIANVKCLAPNCGKELDPHPVIQEPQRKKRRRKEDRTLDPSELLQIPLEQETVQRYARLKRKKMLESDRTTVYCPRQWCQGAARSKKYPKTGDYSQPADSDLEDDTEEPQTYDKNANEDTLPPPGERLAVCEDCAFAFCKVCKAGWHGEFARCFPRRKYELTAEEKASEDYMKLHTTPCPTCDARAQKTMGCNHMICFKCNTHFCYLCSAWLDAENPYIHFNTEKSPCYMRLWELEGGDGGEGVGLGFGGGVMHGGHLPPFPIMYDESDPEDDQIDPVPPPPPAPPARGQANAPRRNQPIAPRPQNAPRQNPPVPAARLAPPVAEPVHRRPLAQGLQRFLQLVEVDEEDDWDSDEFDEDGGDAEWWEVPVR
ncbi:ring finger protein [Lasallia pustulata]|uniref:RBR-type E3 ubiquitin transferase n=1 Tax=Lasallia pustulata TaxID=136370 RepID=A0A1W5D1M9_9LECA|nr:ring finger protein [Lasallia pustulata]